MRLIRDILLVGFCILVVKMILSLFTQDHDPPGS